MLGVSPVGWLDRVGPQPNSGRVELELVARDHVILAVLDRHARAVAVEIVPQDFRLVAIASPHTVLTPPRTIGDDLVAAERGLHAVRGRVADIVPVQEIVVRPARAGVHRRLSRPQEDPVAAVRHRVERDHVA